MVNVGDEVVLVNNAGPLDGREPVRYAKRGDCGVVIARDEDYGRYYVKVKFDHGYISPNWMIERFERAGGPW